MRRSQDAERGGRLAESLCAVWLQMRGWRIRGRRVRTPAGEIDLVATRGGTIAFIEVKRRPELATAASAILPRQQERIARAAAAFLQRRPHFAGLQPRFDVMLVAPWSLPVHIPNAWHILG